MEKPSGQVEGRPRRGVGIVLVTGFYIVLALNGLSQAAGMGIGKLGGPAMLGVLQLASGLSAVAAAIGAWRNARWSSLAAVSYGAITAVMLLSLPALIGLHSEERAGVWSGAAIVLLVGVAAGWYLHRQHHRDG